MTVAFDREADSLESAIRSALDDITKVGASVEKVVLEEEEIRSWTA